MFRTFRPEKHYSITLPCQRRIPRSACQEREGLKPRFLSAAAILFTFDVKHKATYIQTNSSAARMPWRHGGDRSGSISSAPCMDRRRCDVEIPVATEGANMTDGMRPVHPGKILRVELDGIGLSANALAKALGVPANRITAILNEQRSITADSALRLARYFGTTADFWMGLQASFDVRKARESAGQEIERTVAPREKRSPDFQNRIGLEFPQSSK